MQPFRTTGYIKPAQESTREALSAVEGATLTPASHITDITPFKQPGNIFMQGQQPSCVAHGITWAVMYYYWKQTGQVKILSPRFLYALCKANDGIPNQEGTYIETAIAMAEKYGVCEESYFPAGTLTAQSFSNDTLLNQALATYKDVTLIPAAAYANALNYRLDPAKTKKLTDLSMAGLNTAIYQNSIIVIGTDVSDHWWLPSWLASAILPLQPSDVANPTVSGHCVDLYAYGEPWDGTHPTNQYGMNWWSSAWAYVGRFCYGLNYVPTIYEAFVVGLLVQAAPQVAPVAVLPEVKTSLLQEIEAAVHKYL